MSKAAILAGEMQTFCGHTNIMWSILDYEQSLYGMHMRS